MSEVELRLLEVGCVAVLVAANGFFVAAELAFVRIRDTQLDSLANKGDRRAKLARHILANIDSYIGATQFGITLASLGLGAVAEPFFHSLLDPAYVALGIETARVQRWISAGFGFFISAYLLIVLGELAPKATAIRKVLPVALWTARPLHWFYCCSFPFIWVLNRTSQWLLRQFGIAAADDSHAAHSDEELRLVLTAAQRRSGGTKLGRDIVLNALDLRRRVVRDVMRPRQEVAGLNTESTIAECLEVVEQTRYSRFPLCKGGDLDRTIGVVHIKDLYALRAKANTGAELAPAAKKLIYVPETARLEKLLQLFLERKLHFALVVDEYGATTGMATLENILEELVGQIQDEFDAEKALVERKGEQVWEISGALPLHELSDLVGDVVREEEVTTTSGLVTRRLGGFPKVGDRLPLGNFEVTVEEVDGVRVSRLKLARRALSAGDSGQTGLFTRPS
ncbi:MAG: HlyC/CorC family transporter [Verrucomicrobia bacterium]|nr:HlyC/CorC family transporter [Verrucomicrobiota bacterium]